MSGYDGAKDQTVGAGFAAGNPYDDTLPDILPNGLQPHRIAIDLTCLIPLPAESPVLDFEKIGEIRVYRQRNFTGRRTGCVVIR